MENNARIISIKVGWGEGSVEYYTDKPRFYAHHQEKVNLIRETHLMSVYEAHRDTYFIQVKDPTQVLKEQLTKAADRPDSHSSSVQVRESGVWVFLRTSDGSEVSHNLTNATADTDMIKRTLARWAEEELERRKR